MICFALPTSLGIYKLKLEVDFGGTEINVAASTFIGLFIMTFERYDAYRMTKIPLLNRLIIFINGKNLFVFEDIAAQFFHQGTSN